MTSPSPLPSVPVALPGMAVLQAQGADAGTFLQGQLTNDVIHLADDQACLAGYCTAKGRLLATMVIWRDATSAETPTYWMLVRADLAQALAKRLTMFVLRAKVKLQVSSRTVAGQFLPAAQDGGQADWSVSHDATGTLIQAPSADATVRRVWRIAAPIQDAAAPNDGAVSAGAGMPADIDADAARAQPQQLNVAQGDANPASDAAAAWRQADIAAGLPWICAANQDTYIPQTLNLDLIGAINFRKGCYPGQEVVARSHYRGTIKRRMAYATARRLAKAGGVANEAEVGTDIFDARKPDAPCGRIINLACPADGLHVLMEVQLSDLPDADFRLGAPDGPALQLQALPYRLTTD